MADSQPDPALSETKKSPVLEIGVIGADAIGQALARQWRKAGYDVITSNSRGPESLSSLVRDLGIGIRASTVKEAAAAEIVILTVPWRHLGQALADLPPWENRIVVDTTNPPGPPDFKVANLGGRTSSEVVADLVPGARLLKAFNILPPERLLDPQQAGGRRVIFFSGDDWAAKRDVAKLVQQLGFFGRLRWCHRWISQTREVTDTRRRDRNPFHNHYL